jgi:signal transduction histidine kinase
MIDVRTLLFANAVVFAILAIAMLLVWRANPKLPGLASLARVHVSMMAGVALIGLPPGPVPYVALLLAGNALVVLSTVWLLDGVRALYGRPAARWPRFALLLWLAVLLFFLYGQPSLRGRILATSCAAAIVLGTAAWTTRLGVRQPEGRAPSLLILGSLGLLCTVFVARCISVAIGDGRMQPVSGDLPTLALVIASLMAGTGWTLGVMNLVYARLNAAAWRAQAGLEQLVQVAAHELRNPLTSILATLRMLTSPAGAFSGDERASLLDVARRNSERMVRLINDLLDLEHLESGHAVFSLELLEVDRLLAQTRELSEGLARHLGVRIDLQPLPGASVQADPQKLVQVMINLLTNALRYSPPGESVWLSASRRDGAVRVEVRDHGPGIPRELRPRIFQRFARGEPPSRGDVDGKGSGLGLAISKALIEGMGGRIGFETAEAAGTTFYFELPEPSS